MWVNTSLTFEYIIPYACIRFFQTNNASIAMEKDFFLWFCVRYFGGRWSPYHGCHGKSRILEWVVGNKEEQGNFWQWERVRLNLATSINWDHPFFG